METSSLIKRFDTAIVRCLEAHPQPTGASVKKIEAHFGIKLPRSLLHFAKRSEAFANWFASLGPDFDSPSHIIRINSYWRRRRPQRAIPRHFVVFNLGFDDDLSGFDTRSLDANTNEYAIQFWSPGIEDGARYRDFYHYMESHLESWEKT